MRSDCPGGLCLDGYCRAVECATDAHCEAGETCQNERCEPRISGCQDLDGDGYGEGASCIDIDCDDLDPNVNRGMEENRDSLCSDGIDHDCDGIDPICGEFDQDGDGHTIEDGDCDDTRADVNPARSETPYNGRDDDCDPATSDDDIDGDGFRAISQGGRDCNDLNPEVNPSVMEIPGNGVDEDCDGVDQAHTGDDLDGDGFSEQMGDCDDGNASVNPSTNEVPYNGRDDDCNPATTDDDIDEDGFRLAEDCDDYDPDVNPGRREYFYNGIDDDCDPETVDNDADGDGYRASDVMGSDCNDRAGSVNSNALEVPYNGIDDDCDPETPDDDIDGDGVNRQDDCDDLNPDINPNVIENSRDNCGDGIDHNCRAGDVPCDPFANDRDGDGVPDDMDCEPLDPNVPGVREVLNNGIDDDCNPRTADLLNQCFDDEFDVEAQNGSAPRATVVVDGNTRDIQYPGLVLCPHDEDWYRIGLNDSDGLEFDIFFDQNEGDLDLALFEMGVDRTLIPIDASQGNMGHESVSVRRHGGGTTDYYLRVYRFVPSDQPTPYGLTVTVMERCADDPSGPYGEQNDTAMTAAELPPAGLVRRACSYDDDWYRVDVDRLRQVALHLLFNHADGDLDLSLHDAQGERLSTSVTVTDDELITAQLDAGTYYARVYGFQGHQNQYHFIKALEPTRRIRATIRAPIQLNDYRRGLMGTIDIPLEIQAPEGSIIRRLYIRDLQIQHTFLNDLRLIGVWNGQPRVFFWNHDGAYGLDGGLDDDDSPFTHQDINFNQRSYSEFSGLPADGQFILRVEDWVEGDTGSLTDLDIEVEYFLPERDLP